MSTLHHVASVAVATKRCEELVAYTSRHYHSLASWSTGRLRRWVRWVALTDRAPARNASPDALARTIDRWGRSRRRSGSLPPPLARDLGTGDGSITALRTVDDVCRESIRMEHCLFEHYLDVLVAGECTAFSLRTRGARSTVLAQRDVAGRIRVIEHAGFRNSTPSPRARSFVERWSRGT